MLTTRSLLYIKKRELGLTCSTVTSAPSGNDADSLFLSSVATSKLSNRCIIEGNKDNELPISFEKPIIFNWQISGGNSMKCSTFSRNSAFDYY